MSKLTLILGGARSGKSSFAEDMARRLGGDDVLYVATAEALDSEMQDRIEKHRAQRPSAWRTLEAPLHPGPMLLEQHPTESVFLLDCLTMLVSNLLLAHEHAGESAVEDAVQEAVRQIIAAASQTDAHLIIVSNEVGLGLVPANALGRIYRDVLGRANQTLARAADEVIFLVAGLPMIVKPSRTFTPG
jgi:adenosylcobinamide kinase/adenosylcobinamide-phosphate guanylyltransferase